MDISVIIPAYGREQLLIECLKSLGNDSVPFSYEVCVVDDGSGLNETSIRERVQASYHLTWITLSKQAGRSTARNFGIAATTGKTVIFLDSDMEAEKGFLSTHYEAHTTQSKVAAVGTIIWPNRGRFHQYIGSRGIAKLNEHDEVPPWYFVTGNASINRSDLPGQGPFDETLDGWGGEDLDLGMRLSYNGMRFVAIRNAKARHNFTGTLQEHTRRTRAYGSNVLPLLIERYPELKNVLRLDMTTKPFMKFIISSPISGLVQNAAGLFDKLPLPDIIYDYLTYSSYARGWIDRDNS